MEETETDTADSKETGSEGRNISWLKAIASVITALLFAGMAAWGTANLFGIAPVVFVVAWIGGSYYLYQKPSPRWAVGDGLILTALMTVALPLLFYLPQVFATSESESLEGSAAFIGSALGLVIWGFVFLLIGLLVGVVGFLIRRSAKKKVTKSPEREPNTAEDIIDG